MFGKKQELQRLNLEAPKPQMPEVDPVRLEAVNRKAREILDADRIPVALVVCTVGNGLLTFLPGAGQKPVMLLFSSIFAATDYLRATGTTGGTGQLKVEALPGLAQTWMTVGLEAAVLDRCPRCPQFLSMALAQMAKWTREDFAKTWAHLRATRQVLGEIRYRSAMSRLSAGSLAEARADLEYIRDHFDCGIPYLHQMIGMIAGMQNDHTAKAAAMERLREFGAEFEGPVDFSPQLMATATVGMMLNFGIAPGAVKAPGNSESPL
jgi:hypothetical protein